MPVEIIFIPDWEQECSDNPNAPLWGDWDAMARYLAQWDYGDEPNTHNTPNATHDVSMGFFIGGLVYTLTVNKDMGYVLLTRLPLKGGV